MARSRRLGIAGEVSVWQIPENSVNLARVTSGRWIAARFFAARFFAARFFAARFLCGKNVDGRFPYWKNDHWSIFQ